MIPPFGGSSPSGGASNSELPERPIGASWKGDGSARGTRVRISHSLPNGRLSRLGLALFRKQRDYIVVGVRFLNLPPLMGLLRPGSHA